MKIDKELLTIIGIETKEAYIRNYNNSRYFDNKIIQLFTLFTALLTVFIKWISISGKLVVLILFFASLLFLLAAYNPLNYFALDPEKIIFNIENNKYSNKFALKKEMIGQTADNINSLKNINSYKQFFIRLSISSIVVAILIAILLNI